MSMYGIGAIKGGVNSTDNSRQCADGNYVYIGFPRGKHPSIDRIFDAMKPGDLVYVKSSNQQGLSIKSIHIITDDAVYSNEGGTMGNHVGYYRDAYCLWSADVEEGWLHIPLNSDRLANIRASVVYPELDVDVQMLIAKTIKERLQ